MKRIKAVF